MVLWRRSFPGPRTDSVSCGEVDDEAENPRRAGSAGTAGNYEDQATPDVRGPFRYNLGNVAVEISGLEAVRQA